MLIKFAFDIDTLDNSRKTSAHIKRFRKQWSYCGILVFPPFEDRMSIFARAASLERRPRQLWIKAWQEIAKNRKNNYRWLSAINEDSFNFDNLRSCDDLAKYSDRFEVAILQEQRADALAIPEGESRYCGRVEGIRLPEIDLSVEFERAEFIGKDRIRRNTLVETLWEERFRSFAQHSDEVAIVDPYALQNGDNIKGFFRFLDLLDGDSNRCKVTIYSKARGKLTNEKTHEKIPNIKRELTAGASLLTSGGISELEIRLYSENAFKRYAHDRHIRFNSNVFRIGRGMDIFNYAKVERATDVAHVVLPSGQNEHKEEDLMNNAPSTPFFPIPIGPPTP